MTISVKIHISGNRPASVKQTNEIGEVTRTELLQPNEEKTFGIHGTEQLTIQEGAKAS